MEGFIDIIGYENIYMINIKGEILNIKKNKFLKPDTSSKYYRIPLSKNGKTNKQMLHRLIAIHFIHNDDPLNKIFVDHINRNMLDNRVENLRWITQSDNCFNTKKKINNNSGFKNITIINNKHKERFRIKIEKQGIILFCKYYDKPEYTLEDVIIIRNQIYIENGLEQHD
jgi:hypothetical protein